MASKKEVMPSKCPQCGSEKRSLHKRIPGDPLDFSCHDYWCEHLWHCTAQESKAEQVSTPEPQAQWFVTKSVRKQALRFTEDGSNWIAVHQFMQRQCPVNVPTFYVEIQTLEGVMMAKRGDWIIRGIAGEFYSCKPDIFAATYEPVAASQSAEPPTRWDRIAGDREVEVAEPVVPPKCPTCGLGVDTNGDGDCACCGPKRVKRAEPLVPSSACPSCGEMGYYPCSNQFHSGGLPSTQGEGWVKVEERLPEPGVINPCNTAPRKYFIQYAYGRIEWDVFWLNKYKKYEVVAWLDWALPSPPTQGAKMKYRDANWFWRSFLILNGIVILALIATLVWAAFNIHERIGFVFIAQVPALIMMAIRRSFR